MKKLNYLSLIVVATLIWSCNPKSEGTNAEVSEATEVQEVTGATVYAINLSESSVSWIGSKPTGKHDGTIPITEGKLDIEGDQIIGGNIILAVSDIQNNDLAEKPDMQAKLVGHLKSADFFDTENHPTASFTITEVSAYNPEEVEQAKEEFESEYKPASSDEYRVKTPTHKVTGNLTMRGKTLSISFPANVQLENGKLMARAKFNIDRSLWDLKYQDEASVVDKAKDKFIYNTVNVGFNIVADAPAM